MYSSESLGGIGRLRQEPSQLVPRFLSLCYSNLCSPRLLLSRQPHKTESSQGIHYTPPFIYIPNSHPLLFFFFPHSSHCAPTHPPHPLLLFSSVFAPLFIILSQLFYYCSCCIFLLINISLFVTVGFSFHFVGSSKRTPHHPLSQTGRGRGATCRA